jgi:hypothetical protein
MQVINTAISVKDRPGFFFETASLSKPTKSVENFNFFRLRAFAVKLESKPKPAQESTPTFVGVGENS